MHSTSYDNQRYKIIFESSPNGIVYFDKFGNITDANKTAMDIFGYKTKDEFKGINVLNKVTNQKLKNAIKESLRSGKAEFSDWYFTSLPNKTIYLEIIFRGVFDERGEVNSVIAAVKDRTKEIKIISELESSRKDWKSIIDNILNIFIQTDADGRITKASPSVKKILGYEIDELIGKYISNFWYDKKISAEFRNEYIKNPQPVKYKEMVFLTKSGEKVVLNGTISPRFDDEGNYIGSDNFAEDITKRVESEKELVLYKKIIENTSEGVVISDNKNRIKYVNPAFSEITGYSYEEIIGKSPDLLKSNIHSKEFYKKMWDSINALGSWSGEIWNRHKSGKIYPEFLTIDTITEKDDSGKKLVTHYIAIITDITEIKKSEEKMRYMAMHDSLTSLPNRLMFEGMLEHAIISANRNNRKVGVLFLDLDNFKMINDNYGHHEGDKVLQETAKRLKETLRSEDLVCRFGGDEFVIVLENIKENKDIADIISKIQNSLNKSFQTENYRHYISSSIGIAIYPEDSTNCIDLIKHADTAMYDAKRSGKNRCSFYLKSLGEKLEKELQMANFLRDALKNEEFELYFQPKISTLDKSVVGLEALLRWKNPKLGIVNPNDFIGVAEKTHLIINIGGWVLKEACRLVKKLVDDGLYKGTISVNISGVQLNNDDIATRIESVIKETGIDPKLLDLEITESILMSNPQRWSYLFDKIKKMGVDLSIDDFGTGYSSLSYLREFPIDELKIDKSFIDDLPNNRDACVLAKTIILLAKSLGFKIVAEGVETKEQMEYLKEQGCDIIQGYYYSKPLPLKELKEFLLSNKPE